MRCTAVFFALDSNSARPNFASMQADFLEPCDGPASIGIELAFLLSDDLIKHLIDEHEGRAHRHRQSRRPP